MTSFEEHRNNHQRVHKAIQKQIQEVDTKMEYLEKHKPYWNVMIPVAKTNRVEVSKWHHRLRQYPEEVDVKALKTYTLNTKTLMQDRHFWRARFVLARLRLYIIGLNVLWIIKQIILGVIYIFWAIVQALYAIVRAVLEIGAYLLRFITGWR